MNSKQNEPQPSAQAGWPRKAERVAGEVGVLHSSVDLWERTTHGEPREGTCSKARKRSAGCGDGSRELTAPETVRKLQLTLYRKANALLDEQPLAALAVAQTRMPLRVA